VGGSDGWRLTKAVEMVGMMGMCLRTGGIPGIMAAREGREASEMDGEKAAWLPV